MDVKGGLRKGMVKKADERDGTEGWGGDNRRGWEDQKNKMKISFTD